MTQREESESMRSQEGKKKKKVAQQKNKQNPRIDSEIQIDEWRIFKVLAQWKGHGSLSNLFGIGSYQNSIILIHF